VFEGEPSVHPALLTVPNVVLTPHIASATVATRRAMGRLAADNLVAVLGGQAELGIAVQGEKHPDLSETVLFADPLTFICRTPHALEGRKSVTWNDMRDADLIGISSFMATRIFMDYQLAKRGIRLHGNYEVQHHATAMNLVAAGVGSAILPSSCFQAGDRPGVRKIPLTQPTVKRKVVLLKLRRGGLSPAAEAFQSMLQEAASAL